MTEEYRFRTKEGKILVQKLVNNKWTSRTLPGAKEVWEWLCPPIVSPIKEENRQEQEDKVRLIDINRMDTKDKLQEEQTEISLKQLKEAQNKIMDDILK